ncbi:tyrosine tRS [Acrasis kona]|uniref:Tyrosine tRS n=1 Tax=Acrasis kona TaxID=1008807 RepID=A0AAW2YTV4_9EUKA
MLKRVTSIFPKRSLAKLSIGRFYTQDRAVEYNEQHDKNKLVQTQTISPYTLKVCVGRILSVTRHHNADSLYVEEIDVGEDKPRIVCSGLVGKVEESQMQDQQVLVVCNLKPSNMRGVKSEAMILCASDDANNVQLLKIPSTATVGERVEYENCERHDPDERVNDKKLTKIMSLWGTDSQGNVVYNKTHTVKVSGQAVTSSYVNSVVK